MSCDSAVEFNHGDELVVTFLLRDRTGAIMDIAGLTITAEIWSRKRKLYTLTTAAGITIENTNPPDAADDEDQLPHGVFRLTEVQAQSLAFGRTSYAKLVFVDADSVTLSTKAVDLSKVLA